MPLAKQIGTIAKTNLTNAAHMAMNNEIYDRILAVTVAVLHLESLHGPYKECLDRETQCINRILKSATTEQLVAKDEQRDHIFQFITAVVAAFLKCPDEILCAAAKLLEALLRAYKELYSKSFSEETALIDGLMNDIATTEMQEAIKELNLTKYFTQLQTVNNEYKALDVSRTDEYTARVKTDTSLARKATDNTLELIIQRVNAYAVLEPSAEINGFINTVNQIFRKYKNLISSKGGPSSPTPPPADPYPTPDPNPDDPDQPGEPEKPGDGNNDRPVIE